MFSSVLLASALLPLVFALPHTRRDQVCGQYDVVTSKPYSLLANHWGMYEAYAGSQCSTLKTADGNAVAWTTQWSWSGGDGIKSFSNIQLDEGLNRQLSAINSMPSTWHWSQSSTGKVVSDVAYDLFTSYTAGGSNANEVMIWLANFNAGPIAYEYDASGHAVPIAKNLNIAGHTWNLYQGSNGSNTVYSFLPVSGKIKAFSGDIYGFFKHLMDTGYISDSQYLVRAQAGTEATSGTATLATSYYELSIN
ncbi:glycoside hydrolase family 12 protein [Chiua virens]|nr:glycoside hydrolase family 12 protein [Chiua virens]